MLGGDANMRIVAAPDRVQAWRSVGFMKERERSEPAPGDYYQKAGEGTTVPGPIAKQLSRSLLDPATYWFHPGSAKNCAPTPGFILSFTKGGQTLDVFLCFQCDIIQFQPGGGGDFDPSHKQLIRLMKLVFPQDSTVQMLIEEKG